MTPNAESGNSPSAPSLLSIKGQYADLPGVRLWYLDSAQDAPTIVFLHANTGTSAIWDAQLSYFTAAGYRTVALDRRGWGQSVADPSTGAQPGSVAEDLDALVRALELPPFHLVGIAGGTFSALDYASWRPDHVRTLVAAASTGMIVDAEISEFIARISVPGLVAPNPAVYREVSAGYRGSDQRGTARWVEIETTARQPDGNVALVRTPNTYAKLKLITAPVLALAGGADIIAPPAMMRLWAAQLADVEFATITEAGHAVAYEQPQSFNNSVHSFLQRRGG
jgi:pimeloyl-ACP methyl ester carboxylesterase